MNRVIITLLALIIYCVSNFFYTHELYAPILFLPIYQMKTWYCFNCLFILGFTRADEKIGYTGYLHEQFNLVCSGSLFINLFMVILTYQSIIINIEKSLYIFNGSILVTTIMIFIAGCKHGTFKD